MLVKVYVKHGSRYPSPNQQGTGDLPEVGQASDRQGGNQTSGVAARSTRCARAVFQVQHPTALPSAFLEVRADLLLVPPPLIIFFWFLVLLSEFLSEGRHD